MLFLLRLGVLGPRYVAFKTISRLLFTTETLPLNKVDPKQYQQAVPGPDDEIIVGMSSGVDLSVAASLYAEKFKNVRGIYMANWSQTAKCLEDEWKDVQKVCLQLGIPCERVNFEKEYWTDVFEPMIEMYKNGMTPNPDVGCNKFVKFGSMVKHLHERQSTSTTSKKWWLVMGHYARIMRHEPDQKFHLLRGLYPYKDQSYYLLMMPLNILSRVLMPIGHLTKPEVREMALARGLLTAKKPDSQGLCFVGQDQTRFSNFLSEFIVPKKGTFITKDEGLVVGEHDGVWLATIGQRARVCMPQGDAKYKGQWFVCEKRVETNQLVIVQGANNPALYSKNLTVIDWDLMDPTIDIERDLSGMSGLTVQHRSLQEKPGIVKSISLKDGKVQINLETEVRALAPGQYIVLYQGNRVLGAGVLLATS